MVPERATSDHIIPIATVTETTILFVSSPATFATSSSHGGSLISQPPSSSNSATLDSSAASLNSALRPNSSRLLTTPPAESIKTTSPTHKQTASPNDLAPSLLVAPSQTLSTSVSTSLDVVAAQAPTATSWSFSFTLDQSLTAELATAAEFTAPTDSITYTFEPSTTSLLGNNALQGFTTSTIPVSTAVATQTQGSSTPITRSSNAPSAIAAAVCLAAAALMVAAFVLWVRRKERRKAGASRMRTTSPEHGHDLEPQTSKSSVQSNHISLDPLPARLSTSEDRLLREPPPIHVHVARRTPTASYRSSAAASTVYSFDSQGNPVLGDPFDMELAQEERPAARNSLF